MSIYFFDLTHFRRLGRIKQFFHSYFGRIEGKKNGFWDSPNIIERNANIERSKEELVAKVTGTKRKSKWDQAGPLGAPQAPITSIPAFGALSKK